MNGEPRIEIIKPFGEGFELMQKILFRPFDMKKWFVIGFAAFLSGHFSGIAGFNFPIGNPRPRHQTTPIFTPPDFGSWKPWMPAIIVGIAIAFFVFIIFLMWLRSRGVFIFTDCLVRNRGAIVGPWREYRKEGNSYFLFSLAVMFGALAVFGLAVLVTVVPLGLLNRNDSGSALTPLIAVVLIGLFLVWIAFAILFALIGYFMMPVMYVRRCGAIDAFREVTALIFDHAGSCILFCLFSICLLLGAGMIGGIAMCLTCCLAALPYIGTVILLPVFVCLRGFGLCFIRQFGPQYDVWSVIPPGPLPIPPPIPS